MNERLRHSERAIQQYNHHITEKEQVMKLPEWLPIAFAAAMAFVLMLAAYNNAMAQGTWSGECTATKPCHAFADPDPAATECVLLGAGAAQTKPVIDKSAVTPIPTHPDFALVKPRTCWWYPIVLAPGSYTITAIVRDGQGRTSDPSSPFAVTVLPPVQIPQNLRLVR